MLYRQLCFRNTISNLYISWDTRNPNPSSLRKKIQYNLCYINYIECCLRSIELYLLCGAREFVTPAYFTLGPKACVEERHCRGHATKIQMA